MREAEIIEGKIKASELRIANWVWKVYAPYSHEQSREYCQIDLEEMKRACGILSVNSFYHEPIPLTPEILEKAGFDQAIQDGMDTYSITISKDGSYLDWHDDGSVLLRGEYNLVDFSASIKHLHQLQNLYFAVAGQELEIKL